MTYQQIIDLFANKVKKYNSEQCEHAMRDINETIDIFGDDMTDGYVIKLYAELDAVRDRQMILNRKS